jgi:hypothetical protein
VNLATVFVSDDRTRSSTSIRPDHDGIFAYNTTYRRTSFSCLEIFRATRGDGGIPNRVFEVESPSFFLNNSDVIHHDN